VGGLGRKITVQGCPRQNMRDLVQKITKEKRSEGEAQMVKHLPSKHKGLSPEYIKKRFLMFRFKILKHVHYVQRLFLGLCLRKTMK
jgi:hypothetical protein